jgi:uncharacterized protein (TIGR02757 family)
MSARVRVQPKIARLLESAFTEFHSHFHREQDPVSLVHRFPERRDREAAALVTALLSYGNVATILASVRLALEALGSSPYAALVDGNRLRSLEGFRHRFTTGEDLEIVFHWVGSALRSHGSLEAFFVDGGADRPMKELLSGFVRRLIRQRLPGALATRVPARDRNLKYLLSDPERGSACKRLNMFLRWMVRGEDGIDLGLWKGIRPAQLVLPVDTHLLQTLRLLRWTRSKQATWRVAEEATDRLRLYAPEDPVRFDFALCHLSMCGESLLRYASMER